MMESGTLLPRRKEGPSAHQDEGEEIPVISSSRQAVQHQRWQENPSGIMQFSTTGQSHKEV